MPTYYIQRPNQILHYLKKHPLMFAVHTYVAMLPQDDSKNADIVVVDRCRRCTFRNCHLCGRPFHQVRPTTGVETQWVPWIAILPQEDNRNNSDLVVSRLRFTSRAPSAPLVELAMQLWLGETANSRDDMLWHSGFVSVGHRTKIIALVFLAVLEVNR
jgi:hypothetical protein